MLVDWINYYDLALLNTPSISTFYYLYKVTLDRLDDIVERYTSAILYAFLEKEDSKSIFKALAYTKLRRLELVLNLKLSAT
ncbi:hypothetical protein LHYA1_G009144 [Lachnellula hyalina]|uniref:Uncharacterized protein n=1 Tax=Lachnellula hyalina TaxID=1316788 RepID=A0A8H8TUC5_9HELO|nr:uncharacterized protein LHYA1_G009144 [Lachnellula hyalina]TVY22137.1 hypothetical protein LHYA1_G009144 [Lachnellula hyalina]